jgi:hypothetical protein
MDCDISKCLDGKASWGRKIYICIKLDNAPVQMSAYLYRDISPPSTNVRMAHLYRVEIRPGTNVPAFVPVLAPTRYKCGLTRHVGGLPSHPVQMPSFVSGVEILSTNEKSTQGQMPDSLVVSLGTL